MESSIHLFKYLGRNKYEFLEENFPFEGRVLWKGTEIGKWTYGKFKYH